MGCKGSQVRILSPRPTVDIAPHRASLGGLDYCLTGCGLRCLSQREREGELAPLSGRAADAYLATMRLHHPLGDVEAETEPLDVHPLGAPPIEALEEAGLLLFRDADALVSHRDDQVMVLV